MWQPVLYVAVGGAAGAVGRYSVGLLVYGWFKHPALPYATIAVNILGCLLIGLLAGWAEARPAALSQGMRLFLITGVLGGFTTFSAFGLETFELLRLARPGAALLYAAVQVLIGLAAVAIGFHLAQWTAAGLPQ